MTQSDLPCDVQAMRRQSPLVQKTAVLGLSVLAAITATPLLVGAASETGTWEAEELITALERVPSRYSVDAGNADTLDEEVRSGEAMRLPGVHSDIGITVSAAAKAGIALNLGDGREAVSHDDETSTIAQRKSDGSIQILTAIESSSAPTEFTYELSLPPESEVTVNDDGSVAILGTDGSFLAGIHTPWAVDAEGNTVSTHYEVDGTHLTQIVSHDEGFAYPIVADPWLGAELYGGVATTYVSEGFIVTTRPTEWGALYSGVQNVAMWWAHADEVKNKMTSPGNWTLSLQEQLYCHIAGWPVSANPDYDLESWKPHIRWEDQVPSKCQSY
ncbi:hypothetical protein J2Y69_002020 [Microbacterium resistens]|uniref:DUF2599 domain-containing protein n=1 Tax=Microbacterium resistens TaxID=156977 RepID=A0ABU1SCT3_9MICO|nr:hypothetical protein [Microbacterium resistens]MDR6867417.1 hypothetical protein [Microbacterium resistens]